MPGGTGRCLALVKSPGSACHLRGAASVHDVHLAQFGRSLDYLEGAEKMSGKDCQAIHDLGLV